jgi:hypothetical protein
VVPLARAADVGDLAADSGGEETFAQLVKRLKATKRDPVLERFFIDGENISVRIDGQGVLPVTPYRRPVGPPVAPGQAPAEQPRRESVPGASTSIYNRALYEQQPPAAPSGLAPSPAPSRGAPAPAAKPAPAQPGTQPAQPGQQQPGKKEEPKNDRFSLIELE